MSRGLAMLRSLLSLILALPVIALGASTLADEPPSLVIEGYTDQLSYEAGETIHFHVSTTAPRYSLEITRLGDKTEHVLTCSDLPGVAYPIPENASSHGCNWPASYQLKVLSIWT